MKTVFWSVALSLYEAWALSVVWNWFLAPSWGALTTLCAFGIVTCLSIARGVNTIAITHLLYGTHETDENENIVLLPIAQKAAPLARFFSDTLSLGFAFVLHTLSVYIGG